ncbi:MAG: MBL fold metallo-hydrolase [Bryobacteraceae bacterium]|nr:MBL fold metallo-hydrolase [Bryobacteraceae bacterium]
MSLMREIRERRVEPKTIVLWWLGQSGYIFKTPEGVVAGIDLYLTDSCATLSNDVDLSRKVPVLISPEELDVDLFICTHNHQDHTDPETIRRLRNKDTARFIGPPPSCRVFRSEGVEHGRIAAAWPQWEFEHKDLSLRGTFALPTDHTDLNHMGFVLRTAAGPGVYITGDTDWTELLLEAASQAPDLLITVINGGFNNLSHFEASKLAAGIKPKAAIPCHYDMFPDNAVDPRQFRASLALNAPAVRYQELRHGAAFVFGTEL